MGFLRKSTQWSQTVWTVTDLTHYIRDLLSVDFRLQDVEVSGEVSNFVRARSGHLYFTLKDENAQLKCVMWRSHAEQLPFLLQEGDAVVANGRVSVYESGGVYQLYVERLEPAGRGNLAAAFEQLKQRLADEGLFDAEYKKPIPLFPRKIGIVTSADAAALRDILNVLQRRYPLVAVLIAPTLVQGSQAPAQIVRAVKWLDGRDDIDTIIIARGGGSIEDLWAFNDEQVARTLFAAVHPVISGVGHEVDFTITDFVADLRAPTPSAAAELAVPDIVEIKAGLEGVQMRLAGEVADRIEQERWRLKTLLRTMLQLSPQRRVESNRQRLDGLHSRLDTAVRQKLTQLNGRIAIAQAALKGVSPAATLSRGYAIARLEDGRLVRSVKDAVPGKVVTVQVVDGTFDSKVQTPKLESE